MLMTVDGVPMLTSQGFDNNLVGVERVEILRGPQSALYGKNAEGGVLNIYTRQPDNTPGYVLMVKWAAVISELYALMPHTR